MTTDLTDQEKSLIREKIQEKYTQAASSPAGCFGYPTGVAGIRQLGYPEELWRDFPVALLESFCGVGNPFSLGPVHPGEAGIGPRLRRRLRRLCGGAPGGAGG